MQNKLLVTVVAVLIVAVVFLSVEFAFLNGEVASLSGTLNRMNQRDKVELSYEGQMIKVHGCTYATMAVNFLVNSGVIYDCIATISYVANNGSSVEITKELGALNINTNHMGTGFQLTAYPVETSFLVNFSSSNPLPLVHIEAYGYTKP